MAAGVRMPIPLSQGMGVLTPNTGYPPYPLTLIPELPLSSLGLANGDQVILTQKAGTVAYAQPTPTVPQSARAETSPISSGGPPAASTTSGGVDYVEIDSGLLIHRVCVLQTL